jgi:hypothetical protein
VEALISALQVGAYAAYFRDRYASLQAVATFGAVFGLAVYLPQNLLNLILLSPVHVPLVAAWTGAGIVGAVLSTLALRAARPSAR